MNGFQMNGRVVDPQKQSIVVELLLMKKTQARLQQRCVSIIFIYAFINWNNSCGWIPYAVFVSASSCNHKQLNLYFLHIFAISRNMAT